jgi:hypothetical protein
MKVGTVPFPPYHHPAERDDDVSPVQVVSHLGGAEAAGVKPPRAFRFFEYFYSAGRILFFFKDSFCMQKSGSVVFYVSLIFSSLRQ